MQPARFRPLVDAEGPFASVYVDDTHNTADAEKQFELRWRTIADDLGRQGADTSLIESVRAGLRETPPAVGLGGLAVIATRGVRFVERLVRPPEWPKVRVSDQPYLVPAIAHGVDDPPYLLAIVDHIGADITVKRCGRTRTVNAGGGGYPVHKAAGPETSGYGDPQPRVEEAIRKNMRAVCEEVTAVFDDVEPELVFVVGEVRSRADLLAALPKRVAERAIEIQAGARGDIDESALAHDIQTHMRLRRVDTIEAAVQRFRMEIERESGSASEALPDVCAALRAGAVETLIIGEIGDAVVLLGDSATAVATTPEALSELGSSRAATVRADEALPYAAVAINAELICTDERLEPQDGIAAILRYPPGSASQS